MNARESIEKNRREWSVRPPALWYTGDGSASVVLPATIRAEIDATGKGVHERAGEGSERGVGEPEDSRAEDSQGR